MTLVIFLEEFPFVSYHRVSLRSPLKIDLLSLDTWGFPTLQILKQCYVHGGKKCSLSHYHKSPFLSSIMTADVIPICLQPSISNAFVSTLPGINLLNV